MGQNDEGNSERSSVQGTASSSGWRLNGESLDRKFSPFERYVENITAIALLSKQDPLTDSEKDQVALYSGWGGLSSFLNYSRQGISDSELAKLKRLTETITPILTNGGSASDLSRDERNHFAVIRPGSGWSTVTINLLGAICRRRDPSGARAMEVFDSARKSALTSFFTPPAVVRTIWESLEKAGFRGGRILEPGAGVGVFIGLMPESIRQNSSIVAVEKDRISAEIMKALYGDRENVRIIDAPFEDAELPSGFFDVAVGNFPFGDFNVYPSAGEGKRRQQRIHDYFLSRFSELLHDGGIMAVINSIYFMDRESPHARSGALESSLALKGAFRLPKDVFSGSGTDVMSDLLFFQKGDPDSLPFLETDTIRSGESEARLNQVFVGDGKNRMLGEVSVEMDRFGKFVAEVKNPEWRDSLKTVTDMMPENIFSRSGTVIDAPENPSPGRSGLVPGSFILTDNDVSVVNEFGQPVPYKGNKNQVAMASGLIRIRDAAKSLIEMESRENVDDEVLDSLRETLNHEYDTFVGKWGPVSARTPQSIFGLDPGCPIILALEDYDSVKNLARKARIFAERVTRHDPPEEHAENASDVLLFSLNRKGKVDPEYMEKISGKTFDELRLELGERIFRTADDRYEVADVYLSGNVREKLSQAKLMAEMDPEFAVNVTALEAVQPKDLLPSEITVKLGASWLDPSIVRHFVSDLARNEGGMNRVVDSDDFSVSRIETDNTWVMAVTKGTKDNLNTYLKNYGTPKKTFLSLLDDALNQRIPVVYKDKSPDDPPEKKAEPDPVETDLAKDKISRIREAFSKWIWQDPERSERIVREYNDRFNVWVKPEFSGNHLTFPGMNPEFVPHPHQKNAVWRTLMTGNTLYAHPVGFGKTATMVMTAIEQKRLGQANRPMIIVPNHMLRQFAGEAQRLYPGANVLAISKDDLAAKNRKVFAAKVVVGNWDLIIATHSVFERLKLSPEEEIRQVETELWKVRSYLEAIKTDPSPGEGISGVDSKTKDMSVKQIEKYIAKIEAKIKEFRDAVKKDDLIPFDKMGVDSLFVDEAHYFKGLYILTKQSRIPGLTGIESARAMDLLFKTRYIMHRTNEERGVHFATGTPVANIMAELYNIQRYLMPKRLADSGLESFDAWSAQFAEAVTQFELAPEGTGYRRNTRIAKYTNVGDLIAIYLQVADVRVRSEVSFKVPEVELTIIPTEGVPYLKKRMQELAVRATRVRSGMVDPSEDNMLSIMTDARKMSVSPFFVDPLAADDPASKVNVALENILRIHLETQNDRLTQLIFCDYGTPGSENRYSVYREIREKLVSKGVTPEEIAFIHDAESDDEKEALFQQVRSGSVRILIGSTGKMGTGTNVQTRLIALHHLDIPWRPADMEQRTGRIQRQGNGNEQVGVYFYPTKGSIDTFMLSAVQRKHRFIEQLMAGKIGVRTVSEEDDNAAYQEIMAASTDNPAIKEKIDLDEEVKRLERRKDAWINERFNARRLIGKSDLEITRLTKELEKVNKDLDAVFPEEFSVTIADVEYKDKSEAAKALIEKWTTTEMGVVGRYGEFEIVKPDRFRYGSFCLMMKRNESHSVTFDSISARLFGRIEANLKSFRVVADNLESDIREERVKMSNFEKMALAPFEYEADLEKALKRQEELIEVLDAEAERVRLEELNGSSREEYFEATFFSSMAGKITETLTEIAEMESVPDMVRMEFLKDSCTVVALKNETPILRGEIPGSFLEANGKTLHIGRLKEAIDLFGSVPEKGMVRITDFISTKEMVYSKTDDGRVPSGGGSVSAWCSLTPLSLSGEAPAETVPEKTVSAPVVNDMPPIMARNLAGMLSDAISSMGEFREERFRFSLDIDDRRTLVVGTDGIRMTWIESVSPGLPVRMDGDLSGARKMIEFLGKRSATPSFSVTNSGAIVMIGRESIAVAGVAPYNDQKKVLSLKPESHVSVSKDEIAGIFEGMPGLPARIGVTPSGMEINAGSSKFLIPGQGDASMPPVWVHSEKFSSMLGSLPGDRIALSVARLPEGKILPFWSGQDFGPEQMTVTILAMPIAKSVEFEEKFQAENRSAHRDTAVVSSPVVEAPESPVSPSSGLTEQSGKLAFRNLARKLEGLAPIVENVEEDQEERATLAR